MKKKSIFDEIREIESQFYTRKLKEVGKNELV